MLSVVFLNRSVQKSFKWIPKHILIQLDLWIKIIETEGYKAMQEIKGYNDHPLQGTRKGQRSSYLSRSWRVIYSTNENTHQLTIEVIEVNNHDY